MVDPPANRSAVAASGLMKERLMSRKLDTGQETGQGLVGKLKRIKL